MAADKYSILLPTYNEKENLPIVIWLIVKYMNERYSNFIIEAMYIKIVDMQISILGINFVSPLSCLRWWDGCTASNRLDETKRKLTDAGKASMSVSSSLIKLTKIKRYFVVT